jgi:hypothetical protein
MVLPLPSHGSSCLCSVEITWGRPLLELASMRPQVAYGSQFQTWHDQACSERGQRATVLADRGFADSMASFPPKPRGCTGGRTNEKSRESKASKTAAISISR